MLETESFWQENVVAIILLIQLFFTSFLCFRSDGNKLINVRGFIILRLGDGLIFCNKSNRVNFCGRKNF